jgi:hypothetical protein
VILGLLGGMASLLSRLVMHIMGYSTFLIYLRLFTHAFTTLEGLVALSL